ncbi:hypothetical protein PINS_up006808 [Pythium insidiosum]|nr:hypothetical protein PINS_up006808 [Pythium insidiosum]
MQRLFVSHAHIFDESVQHFIMQNFIQEVRGTRESLIREHSEVTYLCLGCTAQSHLAKTFRSAMRRTSLMRRCLNAMYPSDKTPPAPSNGSSGDQPSRWRASLVQRVRGTEEVSHPLEACPEVTSTTIVDVVQRELEHISSWDEFDLFALARAVPGQSLALVGHELLEKYELRGNFRTTKSRQLAFLRQFVWLSLLLCVDDVD